MATSMAFKTQKSILSALALLAETLAVLDTDADFIAAGCMPYLHDATHSTLKVPSGSAVRSLKRAGRCHGSPWRTRAVSS